MNWPTKSGEMIVANLAAIINGRREPYTLAQIEAQQRKQKAEARAAKKGGKRAKG